MSAVAGGGGTIRLGISHCLLGARVRYNGDHVRDAFLADTLGSFVEWVPVCPEVELGMGVPREAVRLEGNAEEPRMIGRHTGRDYAPAMQEFARRRVRALGDEDLCGYVLKKNSPSCGMERVKVYGDAPGGAARNGLGLFARELLAAHPLLPVEEEGRLNDPVLRENFVERIFAYRRWKDFLAERFTRGRLVAFHTAHKFLLLSHSPRKFPELGRVVARSRELGAAPTRERYGRLYMEALAERTTVRKHTNVLQHLAGFLKRDLDAESRRELATAVEDYRRGLVPLVVPITLLRHHARVHGAEYVLSQVYLNPHPKELMLRNHA